MEIENTNSIRVLRRNSSDSTVSPSTELGYTNDGFLQDDIIEDIELKRAQLGHRRFSGSVLNVGEVSKTRRLFRSRTVRKTSSLVSTTLKEPEKKAEAKFSSVNYSPTHSLVYMDWLRSYGHNHLIYEWDKWFLTFLIGIFTGLLAAFLNQCIDALVIVKWSRSQDYAAVEDNLLTWGWSFGLSCVFCLISSILVAFIYPPSIGGGTQDVIAYLNGVVVRGAFGLKNLIVKFTSNVFSVSAGMPCAVQGPVITYGAIIGSGVGQFRSKTLKCTPDVFSRLRNAIDRRAFTTAGVAAGVAAAFNAPIGGLLFAMEDLSSFWSKSLSWQVFFASVLATAVAGLIQAGFSGFQFGDVFGLFTLSITEPITTHVALILVAIVLGFVGGILGAVFTLCNTQIVCPARDAVLSKARNPFLKKVLKILECLIIVISFNITFRKHVTLVEVDHSHSYGNYTSPIKLTPFHCQNDDVNETSGDYFYSERIDIPTDNIWRWIDPGLISVMGAGSMLGGVTRLALASTVIVVEMSQDINMVIPVMLSVLVAKFTADDICKPLFKFQLEAKSLPYLDHEPRIALQGEMNELYAILSSDDVFDEQTPNVIINPSVFYDQLSEDYIFDEQAKAERVKSYCKLDYYKTVYVNLDPFINISTTKVEEDFSLHRTYNLFRTLGLRHLVVVDIRNHPVGMITRKDLTPFNIVDRLSVLPKKTLNTDKCLVKQLSVNSNLSENDSVFLPTTAVPIPTLSEKVDHYRDIQDRRLSADSSSRDNSSSCGSSEGSGQSSVIGGIPMNYGNINIKM
ncbi:hypothetical protein LSH36_346g01010 [Paralvinella palmiformis]|uniref:Chloride channel protein n=1 Tax=Paralvinella palmiformis TaxID=53620 RepID=A0AAD9JFW7_9ANNE|nr:hypothetical protein LSH36_346g01010 [Paralvinella palmiformis]